MESLRTSRLAAIGVVLIGLSGLVVALQGWQARGPDSDVVGAIVRAVALVDRGHIPQRGTLTDNNSFRPPGTSWLAVPGVLMFSDPRLVALAGSTALYLGTLAGVFALGRYYFGTSVALFATLLYAFSAVPLDLAGNLLPRGHPFFCTWMVYCAARWVDARRGGWLAAACLLWATGMYVHMEMAPLLLVLPVLWWRYRPPVNWWALGAAAAVALVMWSPYLAFERDRGFMDLQSQLLLRHLERHSVEQVEWCGDAPEPNPQFVVETTPWAPRAMVARVPAMADLIVWNLESRVLGGEFILLALLGGALLTAGAFRGRPRREAPSPALGSPAVGAATLVAIAIVVSEFALRWIAPPASGLSDVLLGARHFYVWLIVLAVLWLALDGRFEPIAAGFRRSWRRDRDARVLVIAFLVPATILVLLTVDLNRMLGIWPLQVLLLAAFVDGYRRCQPASSWRGWALALLVTAVIMANLVALSRIRGWISDGWSGRAPDRIEASGFRFVVCEDEVVHGPGGVH
ncbi:MAG: glycosyltransferase family 39 protein [Vicinamibacterales bacterium]